VGKNDKSSRVYAYHHGHGERSGGNLAHEEQSEAESDEGGRREEHGCWQKDGQESTAGGFWRGGKTIDVNWVEPAANEQTKNEGIWEGGC